MPLTACGPAYASLSQLQSTRRLARRPSRPLALRNPVQSNAKKKRTPLWDACVVLSLT